MMVGEGPGSLKTRHSKELNAGRDGQDFPLLAVNYRETSPPAVATGTADVNKTGRSGVVECGEVIGLLPGFS